jgi:hypothetical protein
VFSAENQQAVKDWEHRRSEIAQLEPIESEETVVG